MPRMADDPDKGTRGGTQPYGRPLRTGQTDAKLRAAPPEPKVVVAPELLAPPAHQRVAKVVGISVSLLVLAAGALFAAVQYRRHGPAVQVLAHGREQLASAHFDEAVNALQLARDQGADPDAVEPLLHAALEGQRDEAALAQARKALAEHRFDDARVDLQSVSASSALHEQATSLATQIEPARTQFLFSTARAAIASGDLQKARTLQKEVAALEPALGQQLAIDVANASGADLHLPPVTLGLDRMGADPAVRKALLGAFKAFDAGELKAAEAQFSAYGTSGKDGTVAAEARALALATHTCAQAIAASPSTSAALLTAARACADVDAEGRPVHTLRAQLALALDADGKAALGAKHPLAALTAFRSAEAAEAADRGARLGMQALRDQAPALAARARAQKGEPEAQELWQVVAAVLPSTDPLRAEAIQALGN